MSEQDPILQPESQSVPDAPGRSPRWVRLAGVALGILLTVALLAVGFWLVTVLKGSSANAASGVPTVLSPPATPDVAQFERAVVTEDGLVDRIGVRIKYVAITAEGGLIDLRYQVVDPDKAAILHSEDNPPLLIDEASGAVVNSLLMGHSHTGTYNPGQTYYMIFENPGNLVQSGGTVSVLLGDSEVEHVIVR